jgi:cyclase
MPFAYGGGLHRFDDIRKVFANGAEKVVLNTAAWRDPDLVRKVAEHFGSQSVVVAIDVKKGMFGKTGVLVGCGREKTGQSPVEWAQEAVARGAGELMITSMDREGSFEGYDRELVRTVAGAVPVPVIAQGGAGSVEEMREVIQSDGAAAAAAGALFVYRSKQRAVLINYPSREDLDERFGIRNPLLE